MKILNVKTVDSENFKVEIDVLRQSQTIRTMLEDLGIDEDSNEDHDIPISNEEVTGEVFKKALAWMEKNRGKPDPETKDEEEDELKEKEHVSMDQLDEWEKNFINMPVSEMFPLLIAGNFLEINGLVKLMVKAVALQIQGKPVEEIRKTFQIEDPKWSPEELQKLKDENAWAYETKK